MDHEPSVLEPSHDAPSEHGRHRPPLSSIPRWVVPVGVGVVVVVILSAGWGLYRRSVAQVNTIALSSEPRPVTVVEASVVHYRATRKYIGTLEPWQQAKVGPQLVSAFVDTVLVRPGDRVKRGDVLATLDCRNASTATQTVAMQAKAMAARQKANASEVVRVQGLLDGGFVSINEVEQRKAGNEADQASLLAVQSMMSGKALEVNDCILRAPFDGEISARHVDPGVFVRPGTPAVGIVDRSTIRLSSDVPEIDFEVVSPKTTTKIKLLATGQEMSGVIARRSPAADNSTRTIHFEIDLVDEKRSIPVGTTGEITVEVGTPVDAIRIPLNGAKVRGAKATVFVVEGDVATSQTLEVLGEEGANLYLKPEIAAGTRIVTEGRSLLRSGDRVFSKLDSARVEPAPKVPAP